MIRREVSLPGSDEAWALISQVEHARLAADLARHWRDPLVSADVQVADRAAVQSEILAAIEHHDDGWAEWEDAPELDPEHGRPRSFMEMPQADSLAIWSKSIAVAEQIGPLAAWIVAGHFAALLKVGDPALSEEARLAAEWNDLMRSRRSEWLQDWIQAAPGRTREVAEFALRALQFFDAASLWVCCTCPTENDAPPRQRQERALSSPNGVRLRFTTHSDRSGHHPHGSETIASIRPWPFEADAVDLSVDCYLAPVDAYVATDELLQAWRTGRLTWQLSDDDRS